MALTALQVEKVTCPKGTSRKKFADTGKTKGLFLYVTAVGAKTWHFRFAIAGKTEYMPLGTYPETTLKIARKKVEEARNLIAQRINPMDEIRERAKPADASRTFGTIAIKWWAIQQHSWKQEHAHKVKIWIERDCKSIANLDVSEIDAGHITEIMQSIDNAGHGKTCVPVLAVIARIFGYALGNRLTRNNPAQGFPLRDVIRPLTPTVHRAAITDPKALGQLLRDIRDLESGSYGVQQALKIMPYLFLRPKEIRGLRWEYIDWDAKLIRLPASEMKKARNHLAPMSKQVMAILTEIQQVTGYAAYVFPNERDASKPLSKNVITNRLRAMGYGGDVMTAHGFRGTASTLLNEQGWDSTVVEMQLAHLTGTKTSRAYNAAQHLSERTRLMQAWADYLDALRDGAAVIPIHRQA